MAHKTYIRHIEGSNTVVLFIHGFLGSPEHFEKFISLLPQDVSVYNILLDGHGGSVLDFAKASMEKWKNQVDEVLRELSSKYENIIITAHSMGTFFAYDSALKYKTNVKCLFLLQTPLKICVKMTAVINMLKSFLNLFPDDEVEKAYKEAHSVKLNFRVWEYIGWIPRYIELFKESKRARETILHLETPCCIFQSAKDELVSIKSVKFIPDKSNINLTILQNSAHFIYKNDDYSHMLNEFGKLFK